MVQKFAFWKWYLQRVTGVILAIGLFVHFIALHFFVDKPLNFSKISGRLDDPWWIAFDLLLLASSLFHGLNGLYAIIIDMDPGPPARAATRWVLVLVGMACFGIGVALLNPFALS